MKTKCKSHLPKGITLFGWMALLVILIMNSSCIPATAQRTQVSINLELPGWAPYYENHQTVRYYYIPDIECYYDVMNREFVYLDDGVWVFSRLLPPAYAWVNLNDCFVVVLNSRVVQPWRHFHYYVAHYPRYYYRTVYRDRYMDNEHRLRGFNENERNVVYNHRNEMGEHPADRRVESRRREETRFENRNENTDRRESRQENSNVRPSQERKTESVRPSEPIKYYGKQVGSPVRVQRNMKKEESNGKEEKSRREGRQR